jgi:hypothetical protein
MYPPWRGRSEPKVRRGGDFSRGRALRSGEDVIPPEVEVEAEPWGRARRRPPSEAEVEAEPWGRAGRRPPVAPEAELGCCKPHPGGWHSSRSGAGGAVFLSGRSVKGRSDCGHFDLAD